MILGGSKVKPLAVIALYILNCFNNLETLADLIKTIPLELNDGRSKPNVNIKKKRKKHIWNPIWTRVLCHKMA